MTEIIRGNVLVTGASVHDRYLDRLRAAGLTVINPEASYPPSNLTEPQLQEILADCAGYLLGGDETATLAVLAAAPKLKVVAFLGANYASFVDASAATDLGILVTNTPGVMANSVAEFAVGELLAARRQLVDYIVNPTLEQRNRRDLAGHAVGLVGLGAVGSRLAEILTCGFQAQVSYFSRTRKPKAEAELGLTYRPLRELVGEVEDLVIAVPATAETTGLINKELLAGRREPISVVNLSPAAVIAPDALRWGLESNYLESVWFDPYYRDPESELVKLQRDSRVKVTPHIGSMTDDARDAMAAMAVASLIEVLRTGSGRHIVNKTV